ncbi:MAG: MFS transporter [Thermomicrobiales bacterium]|nr:MFS transporter [Thermomicrobiales bacterium]
MSPLAGAAFWRRGVWQSVDFTRLWGASVISAFGSAITRLAVPLVAATTLHASPAQMGLLVASENLPILLLGLLAGTWLDRRSKRPVMIAADLVRGALLLAIPIAWWLGALRVELLIAIAFLVGAMSVFFDIASQSLLPVILRDQRLAEGNARLFTGWSIAEIAGPGVAGWLVQVITAPFAIVADAISYLLSAAMLLGIRTDEPVAPRAAGAATPSFSQELLDGLRLVMRDPVLRATALATGLWNVFDGARWAVLILFLTRTLGLDATIIGLVFMASSLGYLIGSLLPQRVAQRVGLGRAILLGIVLAVPSELLTAVAGGPPLQATAMAVAGFFLGGVVIPVYDINQFSLRQAVIPLHMQGRGNATMRTIIRGAVPLGAVLGGLLAERAGLRGVMVFASFGGLAAFLAIWFSPVRELQTLPARAPVTVA